MMVRFEITMVSAASILNGLGMIQKVIAMGTEKKAAGVIVVYVNSGDHVKFEKVLDGDPLVMGYICHPTGDADRKEKSNG